MRFKYKQTLTELSRYRVGDIFKDEYAKNTTGFATKFPCKSWIYIKRFRKTFNPYEANKYINDI